MNLSESKAKEIEDKFIKQSGFSDTEFEYLEEFKFLYSDNSNLTDKERKILKRLQKRLDLTDEQISDIENYVIQKESE